MSAPADPVPDEFMRELAGFIRKRTGEPVEYVSVSFKLMDREPVAVSWRAGMYDRPMPGKQQREDPDGLFGTVWREEREREDEERSPEEH